MAVGEPKQQAKRWWRITQVSWTDWVTQDVYYWLEHSFQYARNINCDDEMHWIKLSQEAVSVSWCSWCQLVSVWSNWVLAVPVTSWDIMRINTSRTSQSSAVVRTVTNTWNSTGASSTYKYVPWTVFQDYFWWWVNWPAGVLYRMSVAWTNDRETIVPHDHDDYTDESIMTPNPNGESMAWNITSILNYNNTRLVVATGSSVTSNPAIWVYYPELERLYKKQHPEDTSDITGKVWWKKVLEFEAWVTIVALTCTFEYLKVWAVDEWWNTKVYYYQGNNNLRSTFVYNVVDLTWVRVTRVYSINGIDYYISSQDWTDGYVNLYKMVGNTPISLFHQRAWLDELDVNFKAPYFVWPCWMDAGYIDWKFYIADCYGLFKFKYNPQGYDRGYMKWGLRNNVQPYWVCFNQGFLYVSYENACYAMREYDTWVDGYQDEWVLISREFEGREWWTVTKMLDEIRLNYELNPDTNNKWTIDVYVSPNNEWKNTHTFTVANKWYKVMQIESKNGKTRVEKSNLFNDLWSSSSSSFKFDWQTITYAIVIKQSTSTHATPIVRQIDLKYHCKDKTNYVYDIN